jgi:Protein of unknown function (DUF2975)
MNKLVIRLLRVALIVLLLASVLVQMLVPGWASAFGSRVPEVAYLVIPYSMAAILFIGCGQVALLATWRLLSFVGDGVIFTWRAVRWVDVIIACAAVATALTATVLVHMLGFLPGDGGPTIYLLAVTIAGGVTFVLFMVVMRGLLVSATAHRTELDGVI